jgi:hypothetical protein
VVVLLAACGGAAAQGPRPNDEKANAPEASATASAAFVMKDVTPTAYADDLKAAGLDPSKLPQLNKLPPEQLRKVMPLVAKSLGVKCTACHDFNAGAATMTPRMHVAEHMWNQFVRIRTIGGDQPVFCDSCHHGSLTVLDRRDRPALEKWMQSNFVETLGAGSCKTCHGEPPRWRFLEAWKK